MQLSRTELVGRFVEQVQRMFSSMRPPVSRELLDLDLTIPQMRTLALLTQGPRRMTELSDALGTGLSSATSMIDRLVQKDLVVRLLDPEDRRLVLCRLTPRGQEKVEQLWRVRRSGIESLAGVLTDEELAQVVNTMEILLEASRRLTPPEPR